MKQTQLPLNEHDSTTDWKSMAIQCGQECHDLRMEVYSLKEKLDRANTEESFIPEGYRVERTSYTDEDGYDITGYIVSTPRKNGVRSNTSVWKSDHDPAHKLLWEILEKHYK